MKKIALAIIDSYPIVQEAYYLSLIATGFDVTIRASSFDEFVKRSRKLHTPIQACLVNVTSIKGADIVVRLKNTIPGIKVVIYATGGILVLSDADLILNKSYSRGKVRHLITELLRFPVVDTG